MDYSLKEVAGRIKDLREAKGYTQEELAKLTGVSVEDYIVLEKGETDFSFTFIYKCAKACGVEVVDILEGTSTTLSSFSITRKGEGLKILKLHGVESRRLKALKKVRFSVLTADKSTREKRFSVDQQIAVIIQPHRTCSRFGGGNYGK